MMSLLSDELKGGMFLGYHVKVSVEEKRWAFLRRFVNISFVVKRGLFLRRLVKISSQAKRGMFFSCFLNISVVVKRGMFLRWLFHISVEVRRGTFTHWQMNCWDFCLSEKRNIHLMLHKILRIRGTFFILNIFLIHIMVNDSEKFHTLWSVNKRLSFHKKGFKMAADTEKWVKTKGISPSLFWGLC